MNEIKPPKKPLIYYYGIAFVLLILFNSLVMPFAEKHQIEEVSYNTFIQKTEDKDIGSVKIEDNEIFLYNCHISPYEQGNRFNHKPDRVRKLLLQKREILKIQDKVKKDGVTIIPLELFLSHGFAKIELGLAKGKKLYDKREAIAKKTQEREMARGVRR